MRVHWMPATLEREDDRVRAQLEEMLTGNSLALDLCGTNFQLRVWAALLGIAAGETVTYGELASRIDMPRAARAVGSAVGSNPLAFFVPCHRVLPAAGGVGNYRWGSVLKRRLLAQEASQTKASMFAPAAIASCAADG